MFLRHQGQSFRSLSFHPFITIYCSCHLVAVVSGVSSSPYLKLAKCGEIKSPDGINKVLFHLTRNSFHLATQWQLGALGGCSCSDEDSEHLWWAGGEVFMWQVD